MKHKIISAYDVIRSGSYITGRTPVDIKVKLTTVKKTTSKEFAGYLTDILQK